MAHDDKFSHAGIRKQLGLPDRTGAQEITNGAPCSPWRHRTLKPNDACTSKRGRCAIEPASRA